MSADNGIYILKTKEQYRVAHLQGADNIIWSHIDGACDRLVPTRVVEMFGDCKLTRKQKIAFSIADKMLKEQFCEYGIVHLEYPGTWSEILNSAKEYAQKEINYIKGYAPQNSHALERLQKIVMMDCPKIESEKIRIKDKNVIQKKY